MEIDEIRTSDEEMFDDEDADNEYAAISDSEDFTVDDCIGISRQYATRQMASNDKKLKSKIEQSSAHFKTVLDTMDIDDLSSNDLSEEDFSDDFSDMD